MPFQVDENGVFYVHDDGVFYYDDVCCCDGEVTNPCVDEPEMLVTVTGTTGTFYWCQETWVLPGDSGVEKSVCPSTYIKQQYDSSHYRHNWKVGTPSSVLQIDRLADGANQRGNNLAVMLDRSTHASGYYGVNVTDIGLISTVPYPTYSAYEIIDAFFGSHTISGVTFTWAKGLGWP